MEKPNLEAAHTSKQIAILNILKKSPPILIGNEVYEIMEQVYVDSSQVGAKEWLIENNFITKMDTPPSSEEIEKIKKRRGWKTVHKLTAYYRNNMKDA